MSPLIYLFGSLILAETMQRIGIRAFIGKLSMDISTRPTYVEPTHSESIASARSFIDRMRALTSHLPDHARLVEPVLTPRFVPTCSDALLRGLGEIAEETGIRVQSHLAEARDQMKAVQESRGMSDLKVFERVSRLQECVALRLTVWPGLLVDPTNDPSALHLPFSRGTFAACSTRNGHRTLPALKCVLFCAAIRPAGSVGSWRTCWPGYGCRRRLQH
jgi:guanine deaminase